LSHRFSSQEGGRFTGLTVLGKQGPRWTGKINLAPDRLDQPLRWRDAKFVFVNSLSDVWHRDVPFEYVAARFGIMAGAKRHTFQVLTKRAPRMYEFFKWLEAQPGTPLEICVREAAHYLAIQYNSEIQEGKRQGKITTIKAQRERLLPPGEERPEWPLPNVWVGVSVEDQRRADERIPVLRQVPAAVRFLSAEPLLGPVELDLRGIHWVIIGGESGPKARPMDAEWARQIRDTCNEEGVAFFMKQWGNWDEDGVRHASKKETGCQLDGVDWKQMPIPGRAPVGVEIS
jgi:protein gp37